MAKSNQIEIKLLIDKERNRVVFAECDRDFVDVLLSLLTLPIGTITRLLGGQSAVGSIDNLYNSVSHLEKRHLRTLECFYMLNRPRSAYESFCKNLKIKIDDSEPTKYYTCPGPEIGRCEYETVSTIQYRTCGCGKFLSMPYSLNDRCGGFVDGVFKYIGDGGFVNGFFKYIVTDDLQFMPVSTTLVAFSMLKEFGVENSNMLEERLLVVEAAEVLHILRRALLSNAPLTDVFLGKQELTNMVKFDASKTPALHSRDNETKASSHLSIKLMVRRNTRQILYAEAGAKFLDFLFSFLTFPLGSVIKLLGMNSSMGCLNNLYKSVARLNVDGSMICEEYRGMFLDPKLPQHYNCSSQLLRIEEEGPITLSTCKCFYGVHRPPNSFYDAKCQHGTILNAINPKYTTFEVSNGGGFMREEIVYMVTDTLDVKPLSPILAISLLTTLDVPVNDVQEHILQVGEKRALDLLKASLTSRTILNDVFSSYLDYSTY